jgi:hypothetical protein
MKTIVEMIQDELTATEVLYREIARRLDDLDLALVSGNVTEEQFEFLEDYHNERLLMNDLAVVDIEKRLAIAAAGEY